MLYSTLSLLHFNNIYNCLDHHRHTVGISSSFIIHLFGTIARLVALVWTSDQLFVSYHSNLIGIVLFICSLARSPLQTLVVRCVCYAASVIGTITASATSFGRRAVQIVSLLTTTRRFLYIILNLWEKHGCLCKTDEDKNTWGQFFLNVRFSFQRQTPLTLNLTVA